MGGDGGLELEQLCLGRERHVLRLCSGSGSVSSADTSSSSSSAAGNLLTIIDAPRFPWRGLMVDTARHFYPVRALKNS